MGFHTSIPLTIIVNSKNGSGAVMKGNFGVSAIMDGMVFPASVANCVRRIVAFLSRESGTDEPLVVNNVLE